MPKMKHGTKMQACVIRELYCDACNTHRPFNVNALWLKCMECLKCYTCHSSFRCDKCLNYQKLMNVAEDVHQLDMAGLRRLIMKKYVHNLVRKPLTDIDGEV